MTLVSDFRAHQTPVRNQGDRPTCVGFAVSAAHEWMAGDDVVRSPEDAMWAAHQIGSVPGREETSVSWALTGLQIHEHATELAWPYGTPRWPAGRPVAALDAANRRALPGWRALGAVTLQTIRDELERGFAVVLSLRVVRSAWRDPTGIVDAEPGKKTPGNHAVLAVGVRDADDQLIIKNSWGERWGQGGFGFVARRYLDHYALRAHVLEPA